MTRSFKHIGILAGIALIFVSFLFFGRQQDTYLVLLIGGLATALVFYLIILFGKGNLKPKLFWTAVTVFCAVLQQLTEPILIDTSYRYYITKNQNTLKELNGILLNKKGDVIILNDNVTAKADTLTPDEETKLKEGRKQLGVYMISKFDKGVYYGLWGFLDVRLGITYLATQDQTGDQYKHRFPAMLADTSQHQLQFRFSE